MKNHISPCNHPESYLSGSTVESMIDRSKELGCPYFAVTDHGTLASIIRAYIYCKEEGVKLIPGIELFFKDSDCDLARNTESEKIKYFKIIVHFKDQAAYQYVVKMISDQSKRKITIGENEHKIFNWNDLREISKYNVTITTSNVECMVSKHLLVGRADVGVAYYKRLKEIFGSDRFYPSILPFRHDRFWKTFVKTRLNNKIVNLPAYDRVETNIKGKNRPRVIDLTYSRETNVKLTHLYVNKIKHKIKDDCQDILSTQVINDFDMIPGGDVQIKANRFILALARQSGDYNKILINNYSYYATADDKVVQDMKLGEEKRIFQTQYVRSTEESRDYIKEELKLDNESINKFIENSYAWASNFDNFVLKYDYKLPYFEEPEKKLIQIIKDVGRMRWDDPIYVKQFKEEFDLLTKNGKINLIPYFLPIEDIYRFYKENGYLVGPGRGSSSGFLISYLIGITHVNPIEYELHSSRFLTLDRVQTNKLPDIDFDMEDRIPLVGRDGNGGYLFNKYGNKAAQISTRTLLRIKSAILDANRFVNGGKLEKEISDLSKSLPTTPQGVNDNEYIFGYNDNDGNYVQGLIDKSDDLRGYSEARPKEWDIVKRALSLSRQVGRHACAFIISNRPIEEDVPIMEIGGVKRVTQFEHKYCEFAGLVKYDFLVVDALKDIRVCMDHINKKNGDNIETGYFKHNGEKVFIWHLPQNKEVYDMLGNGETETVFQLNTTSATPFVKEIKPQSIMDCAIITSLVRPGPLGFKDEVTGRNMAEEYVERRYGRSGSEIPILEKLIPETHGTFVYQEDLVRIVKELANMSIIDAENVREFMGKKKMKLLESLKPKFIDGAIKKVDLETAEKIWSMMITFGGYGFNKSHAVAYSITSYACAFLKYYYPLEWWASILTNKDDKEINEVLYKYVKDMVLPPDVNLSNEEITIDYDNKKLRNKLSTISGLGKNTADKIISNRPYSSVYNFVKKKPCGESLSKKLVHVGILDSLFDKNDTLLTKMQKYEDASELVAYENKVGQYKKDAGELAKSEADASKLNRKIKSLKNLIEKGPIKGSVDNIYIALHPVTDYLLKKQIFPTMNLDLHKILTNHSKTMIFPRNGNYSIMDERGRENKLVSGEYLQTVDSSDVDGYDYFVTAGYVVNMEEFTYHGGAKKALKLIIDSSGYISEKVVWSDRETNELVYPKNLKKGSIAYFFYYKKEGKPYTNINNIIVENEGVL